MCNLCKWAFRSRQFQCPLALIQAQPRRRVGQPSQRRPCQVHLFTSHKMLHVRLATEGDIPGIVVVSAAAFDPRTDAATAQLFPARLQPDGDPSAAIHSVLTARKSRILAGKGQTLIVATDAGEIAGYAIWTPPTGGDKQERTGDQPVPDGMDAEAVAAMRQGFADDERAALGENGTQSTWRKHRPPRAID